MDCPAVVSDVQATFERDLTSAELTRAQALLDDGWEQILTRVPSVEYRLTVGSLRVGAVVAVLRAAVAAVLRNPGGFIDEAIEDWRGSRNPVTATGRLMLTPDDFAMLMPFTIGGGAFEITLASE